MYIRKKKRKRLFNVFRSPHTVILFSVCITLAFFLLFILGSAIRQGFDVFYNPEDGTTTQPPDYLIPNEVGCESSGGGLFTLQGDYVYYIDNGIYKQHVDGGEPILMEKILCDELNALGDDLYYTTENGIYKLNIYTHLIKKICSIPADKLIVRSDGIYFLNGSGIWYSSFSGDNLQLLYGNACDFLSCLDDIIVVSEDPVYGYELKVMGHEEPFANKVALYMVSENNIYAETITGMSVYDAYDGYASKSLPISFSLVPQRIVPVDNGIICQPRGTKKLVLLSLDNGYEQTIVENVDEFYSVNRHIIYKSDQAWYVCNGNGWQIRKLSQGLPPSIQPSTLHCSNIQLKMDTSELLAGTQNNIQVYIDSELADFAELSRLSVYIKDNTVVTLEAIGDSITVRGISAGQTVLRVASGEKNVFAEVLITVK